MITVSHILQTPPSTLYEELDTKFDGEEWLGWDPETLIEEFPDLRETEGQDDDIARDKILAIQAVASSPNVIQCDFRAFEKVVLAFNNQHVIEDAIQPAEVEEITYAVGEISKILKAVHGIDAEFVGELPTYTAASAKHYGWVALPAELNFAQKTFDSLAGINIGGTKYRENKTLVDAARLLSNQLITANKDITSIDSLEAETKENIVAKRLLGASLYDPTIR